MVEQAMARFRARIKAQKKLRAFFLFSLVFIIVVLVGLFLYFQVFSVDSFSFSASNLYSQTELLAAAPDITGESIFFVDTESIRMEYLKRFPGLVDLRVERDFPSGIRVSFKDGEDIFYLSLGDEYFLISPTREVISKTTERPDDLIEIRGAKVKKCICGQKVEFRDAASDGLVGEFYTALTGENIGAKVDYIDLSDKMALSVSYDKRFLIDLGAPENISYKTTFFVRVIEELKETDCGRISVKDTKEAAVKLTESYPGA